MGIIYGKKSPNLYRDFLKSDSLNPGENIVYIDSTRTSPAVSFSRGKINYIGHNSIKHSERFDNLLWIKNLNISSIVDKNNPLGNKGYYIIYESNPNALNKDHEIHQDVFLEKDKVYNFSLYVKSFGRDNISLYAKDGANMLARVNFIIDGNSQGSYSIDHEPMTEDQANIINIGEGWWRIGITFFNQNQTANGGLYIALKKSGNYQYIGDNNFYNGVCIVGAQFTESHYLCEYLKTNEFENSGPRINSNGLLVEQESRNLFISSDKISGHSFVTSNIPYEYRKIDYLSGINNFANMLQFIDDGSYISKTFYFQNVDYLKESGDYAISFCLKPNGYNHVGIDIRDDTGDYPIASAYFNLQNNYFIKGTGINAFINKLDSDWTQCSLVFNFSYSGYSEQYQTYNLKITPYITISSGEMLGNQAPYVQFQTAIQGLLNSGIYLSMPQIEKNTFPTSYIPNYISGISSRSKEEIEILPDNFKKFYEVEEGSIFIKLRSINEFTGINTILSIYDIDSDSRSIILEKNNQNIIAYLNNDNNNQGVVNITGDFNFSEDFNIVLCFKNNNFNMFVGQSGNVVDSFSASGVMMTNPTKMNIGCNTRGQDHLNSNIQKLFYYPYFMDRSSAIQLCQT